MKLAEIYQHYRSTALTLSISASTDSCFWAQRYLFLPSSDGGADDVYDGVDDSHIDGYLLDIAAEAEFVMRLPRGMERERRKA